MRQKSRQLELPLDARGEAPTCQRSGEARTAAHGDGRPGTDRLMEEVVQRDNAKAALKRVKQNKGSPGIDGMTLSAGRDTSGWRTRPACSKGSTSGSATACGSSNSRSGNVERRSFANCVRGEYPSTPPHWLPASRETGGGRRTAKRSESRCPRATTTDKESRGLPANLNCSNRRMRTRMSGGVGGERRGQSRRPLSR